MKRLRIGGKPILKIFDFQIILSVFFIFFIGIYSIYSTSLYWNEFSTFNKHLAYSFWGFVLMFVVAFLPENRIQSISLPAYIFAVFLLLLCIPFGKEIHGTRGWLNIAGYSTQPSEFAKLALILASAFFLSIPGVTVKNIRGFGLLFVLFLIPIILIALQPDFGTIIIIVGLLWGILFWLGFDLNILLTFAGTTIVSLFLLKGWVEFFLALLLFAILLIYVNRNKLLFGLLLTTIISIIAFVSKDIVTYLPRHQQQRIFAFIDPSYDPLHGSYNLVQSLLAVGSGGLFGKGPFSGTQTQLGYVFAQHSDFIFSVPAEEFGFIGAIMIIIAYFIFVKRVFQIGLETTSAYFRIAILAYGSLLLLHIAQNIGMVIGILPVMGIPLPFMSSGGSFFMINCFLLGLVLNAHRRNKLQ
ncbi:MAG: rod shape-determining protein RodA [Ignavibacteria bacterium]|nr:rod shape-determining protein RodA [Ignavibacteria bacterium]